MYRKQTEVIVTIFYEGILIGTQYGNHHRTKYALKIHSIIEELMNKDWCKVNNNINDEELTMKLRTDFVTNSSSVSYIVTMNLNIVNCFLDNFREFKDMKGTIRIAEALKNYLLENGTVSYLHEHEIYSCLMQFNDDDGSAVSKEILEMNGDNTDP